MALATRARRRELGAVGWSLDVNGLTARLETARRDETVSAIAYLQRGRR
jgi:hypothetical protein